MRKFASFTVISLSIIVVSGIYFAEIRNKQHQPAAEYYEPVDPDKEGRDTNHYVSAYNSGDQVSFGVANPEGSGSWKCIGPFGIPDVRFTATGTGAADHVSIHPDNPAVMYLSVRNGGLFKTTNYGRHWEPVSDYFCSGCYCTAISRSNPDIMYLGAEDNNIWVTEDGCQSWILRDESVKGKVYDIQIDPEDPNRALAATSDGLILTTDMGLTWTKQISGLITDIHVTENWSHIGVTKNYESAQLHPAYYHSSTKGDSWEEVLVTNEFDEVSKVYISFYEPKDGSDLIIFAFVMSDQGASKTGPTRFVGLYKSVDAGTSFSKITNPSYDYPNGPVLLQKKDGGFIELGDGYGGVNPYTSASWVSEFYIDPNNPDHLLTMREKFWISSDGGQSWQMGPSYGGASWADNRYCIENNAKDSLYWCNDGGIWVIAFKDLFPDYQGRSKVYERIGDLCIQEGSQCDISQMNKRVFITGGQDIGQVFTRNGRKTHVGAADDYRGRICPDNDSIFITGKIGIKISGYSDDFTLYNNINADHFDGMRLYGFTQSPVKLVRSPIGANAWQTTRPKNEDSFGWTGSGNSLIEAWEEVVHPGTLGTTAIHAGTFEQSWADGNVAFIGDEVRRKVFITNNLSDAHPVFEQLPNAPASSRYRIATHGNNVNVIALATSRRLYLSTDKGVTWTKIKNLPSSNPFKILMDKNTERGVYAAGSTTVYYIDETLDDWVEFNKGLPKRHITEMRMVHYPGGDSRLVVSKYGRGVWETPLYSVYHDSLPFPDFVIHGTSKSEITLGEYVQLTDLSGNADKIEWELIHESGLKKLTAGNVIEPRFFPIYSGYYTVKQTATNKNGSRSKIKEQLILLKNGYTVSTEETELIYPAVNIYPNPASGAFTVSIKVSQPGDITMKILDNTGRLILNRLLTLSGKAANISVDLSDQAKGIYYVNLIRGKAVKTTRVLIQ